MVTINLFGASGHAKVIMDIIEAQANKVGCLYDDAPHCDHINNLPVYSASNVNVEGPLIVSIGSNKFRKMVVGRIDVDFAKAIYPSATISSSVSIQEGSVIMQGVIIQADTKIGKHCIINSGASIDHECHIGDYVHIAPGSTLCGNVTIGEGTFVGAGTTVIQGIKIGKWCTIGAGSVVIRDLPDGSIAYGNPCKIKQTNMKQSDNQQLMGGGNSLTLNRLAA